MTHKGKNWFILILLVIVVVLLFLKYKAWESVRSSVDYTWPPPPARAQ